MPSESSSNEALSGLTLRFPSYHTPPPASAVDNLAHSAHGAQPSHAANSATFSSPYSQTFQGHSSSQFTPPPTASAHSTLGQIAARFKEEADQDRRQKSDDGNAVRDGDEDDDDGGDGGSGEEGNDQSTGRWTKKEHELFLAALKKYGKEWKKVASMVKTRTVVQTRTHAQKYFQKLAKISGNSSFAGIGAGSGPSDVSVMVESESSQNEATLSGSKRPVRKSAQAARFTRDDDFNIDAPPGRVGRASAQQVKHASRGQFGGRGNLQEMDHDDDYDQRMDHDHDEADEDGDDFLTARDDSVRAQRGGLILNDDFSLPRNMHDDSHFSSERPRARLDFPQPSPAACGKRKAAELKAAQMLVSGGVSRTTSLDFEGAQVLSQLRSEDQISQGPMRIHSVGAKAPLAKRPRPLGLSLSIVNPPEGHGHEDRRTPDLMEPGTPWDHEIHALVHGSSSNYPLFTPVPSTASLSMSVSTPSEQKQFLQKLQRMVRNGDLPNVRALLSAKVAVRSSPGHAFGNSFNEAKAHSESLSTDVAAHPSSDDTQRMLVQRLLGSREHANLVADAIGLDSALFSADVILELVRALTESGVPVQHPVHRVVQGNTCLHLAAQQGLDRVGKYLITKGCPVNAVNSEGNAAVHLAAIAGHGGFLEMLASFGANFHLRNGQALSPIDLAAYASQNPEERGSLRKLMLTAEPRLKTMVLFHPDFLEHSIRKPTDWEGPDRLANILHRLRDRKEFAPHELEVSEQFEKADVTLLGRVHSSDYLSMVNELHKQVQGLVSAQLDGGEHTWTQNDSSWAAKGLRGTPAAPALPFTPHVQKHILRQNSGELKSSDACDTSFSAGTLNAARRAAGAVAHAVDLVLLGRCRNVFCAVRPPGHHSGYRGLLNGADSCGFCIFNNVAAGAYHALEAHNCERVAILDLDIHHGNGTEDIVKRYSHPERLLFFSVHLFDHDPSRGFHFYPGTGERNDFMHNIINVPLLPLWRDPARMTDAVEMASPAGDKHQSDAQRRTSKVSLQPEAPAKVVKEEAPQQLYGREAYRHAITHRLLPALRAFNPGLILLSMGFDAAAGDVGNCRHTANSAPVPGMDLQLEDFAWATTEVLKIADICCAGKVVSVLEGGYGAYDNAKVAQSAKCYSTRTRTNSSSQEQARPAAGMASNAPPAVEINANAPTSSMNRKRLADAVAAHVHRLVDPYGPLRMSSDSGLSESAQK